MARHAKGTWFDWLIARFKQPRTRGILLVVLFVALFVVSYNYFSYRQEQGFRLVERSELTEPNTDLLDRGPGEEGASALTGEEEQEDIDLELLEPGTIAAADEPAPGEQEVTAVLADLVSPMAGDLVQGVGWYYSEVLNEWRYNPGIVIEAPETTEVRAALAGTVSSVEYSELSGVTIEVVHPSGVVVSYGGLANPVVSAGDSVAVTQLLGELGPAPLGDGGSARLQFAITASGEPVDPEEIFGK